MRYMIPFLALLLAGCNIPLGPAPDQNQIAACGQDYGTVSVGMKEGRMLQCLRNTPYVIRTSVIGGHTIKYYRMNDGNQGVFEVTDGLVSGWTYR
jgi:hypothetical protein